jgi:transcriptional regulator with XRE-family HTH domain
MGNKSKNERFAVAVDYLFQSKLVSNQKDLCSKVGLSEPTYSRIKNEKRIVSDDTIRKLNDAFNGIFNMAYFRGDSDVLLANQPEPAKESSDVRYIDNDSILNALLSAKDETICALKQQLATKDEIIQAKDDVIAGLRQQLKSLRSQMEQKELKTELSGYPFPMGAAETERDYKRK